MPGAIGWSAEVLSPRSGIRVRQQFQMLGFYWAGFLCMLLAVLKLTVEGQWSWWHVLLPLWVVLGHNALYITVGFAWLFFADDGAAEDEVTIRQDDGPYGYQLAAMPCFLIFADNLLRRIEGHEEMMWFAVSAGKWELILVSGVLCLVCHLLFWSRIAPAGSPRIR